MKNFLKTAALALSTVAFIACNNPQPDPLPEPPAPKPDPVLTDNSAIYDSSKLVFQSIIVDEQGNAPLLTIFASPKAGITTADQMMANEHISLSVLPADLNKVLDIKTAEDFMFENTTKLCSTISYIDPADKAKLSAGTIKLTIADPAAGTMKAEFDFTLADGSKHFKGLLTTTYTPAPPVSEENYIEYGELSTNFKSIVITDAMSAGMVSIFASEIAGISNYEDMLAQTEEGGYKNKPLMIVVGAADLNSTIDVMNAPGKTLQFINFTGVGDDIKQYQLGTPAEYSPIKSGTVAFTQDAAGQVTVKFDLVSVQTDKHLVGNVAGVLKPAPAPLLNEMMLNGDRVAIASKYVTVDNITGNRVLYFSPLTVTAAEIETSKHFATLMMSEDIMTGNDKDITTISADQFEFSYYNTDAIGFTTKVIIKPGALQNATGTISGSESGSTGAITMSYEITIGDNTLSGQIDKVITPYGN